MLEVTSDEIVGTRDAIVVLSDIAADAIAVTSAVVVVTRVVFDEVDTRKKLLLLRSNRSY